MKLMFANRSKVKEELMVLINVGCGFDMVTGEFMKGAKGEWILMGGHAPVMGLGGKGNTFKSTIGDYLMLSAASNVSQYGVFTTMEVYDAENSKTGERYNKLASIFKIFRDIKLVEDNLIRLSRAFGMAGDVWYANLKEVLIKDKLKNAKSFMVSTPFLDPDTQKPVTILFPCFSMIDALSTFKATAIIEIEEKNELGDSGANTLFMRSGLIKTRLLNEIGSLCNRTGHYTIMMAHIGKKFEMATGPMGPRQTKDMQFMKVDEKSKNVPEAFDFLPNVVFHTCGVRLLNNRDSGGEEYPKNPKDAEKGDVDLNKVKLVTIRNKYGRSGILFEVAVSQEEGVLPDVTFFDNLREAGRFGLVNSGAFWSCILMPELKFTRNTFRETVRQNPKLLRALEICHDILQMKTLKKDLIVYPDMVNLYEKIGVEYGWDVILETRGQYTLNQYEHPVPFLSSYDLLEMYHGIKKPYWWKDKKEAKTNVVTMERKAA